MAGMEFSEILIAAARIIFGLPLALFVPGFLVCLVWFDELKTLEKVGLGFVFSICIDILLGLFLGYNKTMKEITGGITSINLWIYLSLITVFLFGLYLRKLAINKGHYPKPHIKGTRLKFWKKNN